MTKHPALGGAGMLLLIVVALTFVDAIERGIL